MLVDTGSPFTLIDAEDFPTIDFPDRAEIKVDLTFGSFTINNVPALQTSFLTDGQFTIPPIVGGNLMRAFSTQFDYRGMQLRIGEGADPAGVESGEHARLRARRRRRRDDRRRADDAGQVPGDPRRGDRRHRGDLTSDGSRQRRQRGGVAAGAVRRPGRRRARPGHRLRALDGQRPDVGAGHPGPLDHRRQSRWSWVPPSFRWGATQLLDSLAREVGHPVDGLLGGSVPARVPGDDRLPQTEPSPAALRPSVAGSRRVSPRGHRAPSRPATGSPYPRSIRAATPTRSRSPSGTWSFRSTASTWRG